MPKTESELARAVADGIRRDRQRRFNVAWCFVLGFVLCWVVGGVVWLLIPNAVLSGVVGITMFFLPFYWFRRSL